MKTSAFPRFADVSRSGQVHTCHHNSPNAARSSTNAVPTSASERTRMSDANIRRTSAYGRHSAAAKIGTTIGGRTSSSSPGRNWSTVTASTAPQSNGATQARTQRNRVGSRASSRWMFRVWRSDQRQPSTLVRPTSASPIQPIPLTVPPRSRPSTAFERAMMAAITNAAAQMHNTSRANTNHRRAQTIPSRSGSGNGIQSDFRTISAGSTLGGSNGSCIGSGRVGSRGRSSSSAMSTRRTTDRAVKVVTPRTTGPSAYHGNHRTRSRT